MWIKASGTMLGDALDQDVFVPVDLPAISTAILMKQPDADSPSTFLIPGASDLRPSIETSLHAIFPQRIVLHTHCIHTLVHAIQENAEELLAGKLSEFDWAFVPYKKPGANLAHSVMQVLGEATNVVVLGNHGLIVAGETVDEVKDLQNRVHAALALAAAPFSIADMSRLNSICEGTDYVPLQDCVVHQIAFSVEMSSLVTKGSLYPDHVIFCGIAVTALEPNETVSDAQKKAIEKGNPEPICFLAPDMGFIVHKDASNGAHIMLRCLADVILRVPKDAALTYLSDAQNYELLDWDAEKYRQALNAR